MRRVVAILAMLPLAAGAQESAPASRPGREARVDVQDRAGDPLPAAKVRRAAFGRSDSRSPLSPEDRDRLRGWLGGADTGTDGKADVIVPAGSEIPPLVVFKPGYRAVEIRAPGAVNRAVLKDGVQVEVRLPAWLRLPAEASEFLNSRDATIDFRPALDEVWWKSQSVSLYSSATKRTWLPASRETPGQWSPRRVSFKIEPGRYEVRLTLVADTILRQKPHERTLDGTYQWEPFVTAVPAIVTIPDTKEIVTLALDFDRAAYEKTGFAELPERPESRR